MTGLCRLVRIYGLNVTIPIYIFEAWQEILTDWFSPEDPYQGFVEKPRYCSWEDLRPSGLLQRHKFGVVLATDALDLGSTAEIVIRCSVSSNSILQNDGSCSTVNNA